MVGKIKSRPGVPAPARRKGRCPDGRLTWNAQPFIWRRARFLASQYAHMLRVECALPRSKNVSTSTTWQSPA